MSDTPEYILKPAGGLMCLFQTTCFICEKLLHGKAHSFFMGQHRDDGHEMVMHGVCDECHERSREIMLGVKDGK